MTTTHTKLHLSVVSIVYDRTLLTLCFAFAYEVRQKSIRIC